MPAKILFSEEQTNNIIERYKSGESALSIGKIYNVSNKTIQKLLDKNNIANRGNRKHFYNEEVFEKINTAEKAYWIGFITADGYVNESKNFMRIKLQECDKGHLEKFIKFIKGNSNMIKYEYHNLTGKKQYYAEVNGKKFIDSLIKLGIKQKKSTKEQWCEQIPEKYIKDYIRGIIDGDGHIDFNRKSFDICNSYDLLNRLQEYLIKEYDTTKTKIYEHCNTKRIYVTVNALIILKDLYYKRCIALDRKKELVNFMTKHSCHV